MSLTLKQLNRLAKATEAAKNNKLERVAVYDKDPACCSRCSKVLDYDHRRNKYCSHGCAASSNNIGKNRHSSLPCSNRSCQVCGALSRNPKFCSIECQIKSKRDKRMAEIIETGFVRGNPTTIKYYMIQIFGHRCSVCSIEQWQGKPVPLVLDHINGKPSDPKLSNLRLVCGNCNMQLPTFAGRNTGKGGGRPYRMKRYYDGKSW